MIKRGRKPKPRGEITDLIGNKNDDVETPPEIYQALSKTFGTFDFDPCPIVKPDWDGLSIDWGKRNFVNPPFSSIKKWIEKGIEQMKKGNDSVFLITARISSKYWFDLVWPNARKIYFLEGATQFKGYKGKLPIPLAVIYFKSSWKRKSCTTVERFIPSKRWVEIY